MNFTDLTSDSRLYPNLPNLEPVDPAYPDILCRKGSMDLNIFEHMVRWDEYRLNQRRFYPDDRILDIGAHVGYFTLALLRRGIRHIHLYEMNQENLRLCRYHIRNAPDAVQVFDQAVWNQSGLTLSQSDEPPLHDGIVNTGGFSLTEAGNTPVSTIAFDEAVERLTEGFTQRVRLVKLDAEGAEWPILLTAKTLGYVDEIVGEFHEFGGKYDNLVPKQIGLSGYPALTRDLLARTLRQAGFSVRCESNESRFGIFHATRKRSPLAWWRGYA